MSYIIAAATLTTNSEVVSEQINHDGVYVHDTLQDANVAIYEHFEDATDMPYSELIFDGDKASYYDEFSEFTMVYTITKI